MKLKKRQADTIKFYAFISPWIIGFLCFSVIPMIFSFYFSFTKYNILDPPKWVGLDNYIRLFTDEPDFLRALQNTGIFMVFRVFLGLIIPLLVALLFNSGIKGRNIMRTFVYLPAIIPAVGSALIWQFMFSADFGLFNYVLGSLGFQQIEWLSVENAMASIIFMSVWSGIGPTMIILLAGLQGVPQTLYEAADIDGITPFKKLIKITIPLISPTLFYVFITGMIGSIQMFTESKLLTGGGPAGATETLSMMVFANAYNKMGYASAMAWVIFVITLVFTVFFFRYMRGLVYYEGGED